MEEELKISYERFVQEELKPYKLWLEHMCLILVLWQKFSLLLVMPELLGA